MRSRANKRPRLCWRSWPALPPPSRSFTSCCAIASQCSRKESWEVGRRDMTETVKLLTNRKQATDAQIQRTALLLIDVVFRRITVIVPNGAKTIARAAFRFRTIDAFHRELDHKR